MVGKSTSFHSNFVSGEPDGIAGWVSCGAEDSCGLAVGEPGGIGFQECAMSDVAVWTVEHGIPGVCPNDPRVDGV